MIEETLKSEIDSQNPSSEEIIGILDRASRYWLNGERKISTDAEIVVRLLNRAKEFEKILPGSRDVIDALAREAGLYPYLDEDQPLRDDIAREVHRVPGLKNLFFHTEQRGVFSELVEGRNVVLSAPTSFGKTLLVDALIASKRPSHVIIVVPTIALLEERRRTLKERFPDYQIITQSFQEVAAGKVILIGTQERILERSDFPNPDLFVIDEFYKLDLTRGDMRARSLNVLLAKYIDVAKQVYLLGPSIEKNPIDTDGRPNFEFMKTEYSPVAADIIRVDPPGTDPDVLARVLNEEAKGASLVYCRSPKSARVVSRELITHDFRASDELAIRIAGWLRENYHEKWYVADALERGIGIHHGRVPRSINNLMVQLFNAGAIKTLLCTSSLIEGVNTTAENVIIYDKYISIRKLDRFTFDNIKGRAGRMFRHFVGRIFLFNEPPEPIYETLDIPLLREPDNLSDQAILQINPDHLSEGNRRKRLEIFDRLEVPEEILERYSKFGIHEIEKIYLELMELLDSGDTKLIWRGIGEYKNVLAAMETVWGRVDFEKHGVRSARQFAFLANKLQRSSSLSAFLDSVANGDDLDESIDLAFNFLRGAEYSFVDPIKMLDDMINAYHEGTRSSDYSKFLADLGSWGLPGHAKSFEEVGIPVPIIQKLTDRIDIYDIDQGVADVRALMESDQILSSVEIEILNLTLR